MAWKLVGKPQTLPITKQLAEKFANMESALQDRPLSEYRLKVYEKIAKDGAFRPVSWASAFCKETGGSYRINGKHTSTLFSGMDLAQIPPLFAVVEHYECDTLHDVSSLYGSYDSKLQSRTVSDINRAFAATMPGIDEIPLPIITICVSAIWFSQHQEGYARFQPHERAECIFEQPAFIKLVNKFLKGTGNGSNHHLRRMPVIAAMFITWQKAPRVAEEFWEMVRDEQAPKPDHPTRKIGRYLLTHSGKQARIAPIAERISAREFFVKCLHAWNAFRKEEATNLTYHPKAGIPKVV